MLWGNICGSVFEFKRLITFGIKHFLKTFWVAKGTALHLPESKTEKIKDESVWTLQGLSLVITVSNSFSFNWGHRHYFCKVTSIQISFSLSRQFRRPNHEAWLATCLNSLNQGFSKQFLRRIECLLRSCCLVKASVLHCFAFLCNYMEDPQSGSKTSSLDYSLSFSWVQFCLSLGD